MISLGISLPLDDVELLDDEEDELLLLLCSDILSVILGFEKLKSLVDCLAGTPKLPAKLMSPAAGCCWFDGMLDLTRELYLDDLLPLLLILRLDCNGEFELLRGVLALLVALLSVLLPES